MTTGWETSMAIWPIVEWSLKTDQFNTNSSNSRSSSAARLLEMVIVHYHCNFPLFSFLIYFIPLFMHFHLMWLVSIMGVCLYRSGVYNVCLLVFVEVVLVMIKTFVYCQQHVYGWATLTWQLTCCIHHSLMHSALQRFVTNFINIAALSSVVTRRLAA